MAIESTNDTLPPQVSPPEMALSETPYDGLPSGGLVALPVIPGEPDDSDGSADDAAPLLGPGAADLLESLDLDLLGVLEHHRATGKAGEVTVHPTPGHPSIAAVLAVGLGQQRPRDFRAAGAALARRAKDREVLATTVPLLADDAALRAFVEGLVLGSFEFHWRSQGARAQPVERVVLAGGDERQPVVDRALAIARAGWRARALATTPSNLKNPAWLAEQAIGYAEESGLVATVLDEHELEEQGFGGIVAVGRASATPPRLIRLDYTPSGQGRKGRKAPRVVLVGKGITFDTGGLNVKPGEAMSTMKRDMTGGGVVLATMAALADIGCPVRVTALVPAAENAISGSAYRPGDVIRHYGGRTTEVTNTDAEGRLVLADAIAYAVDQLEPDVVVDVATLTGAMKVALGQGTGGFFATHDALADALTAAGDAAGEPLWRMPLLADYAHLLESKVADADNAAGNPGAITAALFLQPFAGDVPWAHLDIASVGDSPSDNGVWTPGPTGFGARTLLHWLEQDAPLAGL